jgi:alanyl-tRNA synthetase
MTPDQLRTQWLAFFEERGHTPWPSASLVPENDPTLLFTGAGMNQFKDMFLGKGNLPFRRAATVQKCFRQGDLENVGRTPRHLTFFEMMGHFSFGDYFKKEAVAWAWEFLRKVLDFPADRLRVSVYQDDEEALEAWLSVGVPKDRIARFDAKENFWPANAPEAGPNGPCGPCSEIFFDYGKEAEVGDGGPQGYDSGRYVEIWNTVFTQFDRRGKDDLVPLPQKNIDCGVGFERVLAAMEGQRSPFGTTLFRPIVSAAAEIAGKAYRFDPKGAIPQDEDSRRIRRIADHVRAASFLVADGVKPSNEERGYVLRRVLRRAIRDGIQLGVDAPFLARLVPAVASTMGKAYPAVGEGERAIRQVLEGEEVRFRETYANGLQYLEEAVRSLRSAKVLPGAVAFKLYDTYGFPPDLAEVILEERGIRVDHDGYAREMEAQRQRARAGSKIKGDIFAGGPLTELKAKGVSLGRFVGHDWPGVEAQSQVWGIILGPSLVESAEKGAEVRLVLRYTPFYAESGGQVGDQGTIVGPHGEVRVEDTQKSENYILHVGRVASGKIAVGDTVVARVDAERRDAIRRNHTATHMLHRVLKHVLGDHVQQEGSLVAPDRLRFDFRHPRAVTPEEIERIEALMNQWIVRNEEAHVEVMDLEKAKSSGAVAMFGEKYEQRVRVLDVPGAADVGGHSRELCGGTHCRRTGDIGSFRITVETSIAAGVRRLEAVTGLGAAAAFAEDRRVLRDLSELLKARPEELADRVRAVQAAARDLQKAQEKAQSEAAAKSADDLAAHAPSVGGVRVQAAAVPGADAKGLKGVWERLRKSGVEAALLVGDAADKAPLLAAATPEAVARGLDASRLLKVASAILGGGGGGKADVAQGQGLDRSRIEEALRAAREHFESVLAAAPR